MDTIILKVGGALLTDKSSEEPLLDKYSLEQVAQEIAQAFKTKKFNLMLVNGAGSYGHPFCLKTRIGEGIKTQEDVRNFAKDISLMNELNILFCNALIEQGMPAIAFQPVPVSIMKNKKLFEMDTSMIQRIILVGGVPVLFGTCALDTEQGCSILSGDEIISFVANKINATRVIFATDVEGIFEEDPKINPDAKILRMLSREELLKIHQQVGGSRGIDTTSGMYGKISEILKIKNIECYVISGRIKGNIRDVLLGSHIGTKLEL